MFRRAIRRAASVALVPALVAPALGARVQPATVDEGSFTVTRDGARVGREEFRVVRQPDATGGMTARATAVYGDRRVTTALQTDADGVPERYQVEVRRVGVVEQRVSAQVAGTHFRAQSVSDGGQAAREYLIDGTTVVVDDEAYHQYYFLLRRGARGGGVPVLAPRRGLQSVVTITLDGADRVSLGGRSVPARHYVLTDRSGGRRELWADDQGRVLRVSLPAEGLEVLRDDPPR